MKFTAQQGFTLYELLITVLVIGVMLTVGVPNLHELAANSRITATANDLHTAFLLGRTEAARAREEVTICASRDASTCDTTSFDDGWILFVDGDADANVDGGEPVLRSFPAVDSSVDISAMDSDGNRADSYTFAPTGTGLGTRDALASATICDGRGNRISAGGWSAARVLIVTPQGRSTVLRDASQIADQGGCP